jgi:hypothetical protein
VEKNSKLHSKRVEKFKNYTPNEWRTRSAFKSVPRNAKYTQNLIDKIVAPEKLLFPGVLRLELHSKRVEKMWNYTRNGWRRCATTLEASGEDVKLHSKRAGKMWDYTPNDCERYFQLEDVRNCTTSPENYTRNECSFGTNVNRSGLASWYHSESWNRSRLYPEETQ